MRGHKWSLGAALGGVVVSLSAGAGLAAGTGQPEPWQVAMQNPVTPLAAEMHSFHTLLMWLITAITVFVAGLLGYCMLRFNEKANPTPSKTAHNTAIEIAWTIVPVLILVLIAIPSFRLLRGQLILPPADMIIKTTGNSWYWSYEYLPNKDVQNGFEFDQRIISDPSDQSKAMPGPDGSPRLLAVDNEVVVPIDKVVHLQTTSADVLHSWGVPSLGFTMDAVPGRLNEIWFKIDRAGVYHGQCRELCGQFHAYMPITIRAMNEADYATWLAEVAKKPDIYKPKEAPPARRADAGR